LPSDGEEIKRHSDPPAHPKVFNADFKLTNQEHYEKTPLKLGWAFLCPALVVAVLILEMVGLADFFKRGYLNQLQPSKLPRS